MECDCAELPLIWELESDEREYDFLHHLTREQTYARPELRGGLDVLYLCPSSHIYWKVDAKGWFAIRIFHAEKWLDFDDEPLRFEYVTDKYGGSGEKKCALYGCAKLSLRDVVWCAKHVGS